MFTQMFKELIGPLLIWLMATVGQVEKLGSDEAIKLFGRHVLKKQMAGVIILLATVALGWQVYRTYKTAKELDDLKRVVDFANARFFNEASGGTVIGSRAYIVDDEKPRVFVFELEGQVYQPSAEILLK